MIAFTSCVLCKDNNSNNTGIGIISQSICACTEFELFLATHFKSEKIFPVHEKFTSEISTYLSCKNLHRESLIIVQILLTMFSKQHGRPVKRTLLNNFCQL